MSSLEWHFWSAEQIVDALPEILATIESRLDDFSEEHREKNQAAVASLRAEPPGPGHIRDGSRSRELLTLGFVLDVLGRRTAGAGTLDESLRLFQAAHEMFRGGNPLLRATKPMRQTVSNAVKILVLHELARCQAGETTAGVIVESVQGFVRSAWGTVPPQLILGVNEMLLSELERVRGRRGVGPGVPRAHRAGQHRDGAGDGSPDPPRADPAAVGRDRRAGGAGGGPAGPARPPPGRGPLRARARRPSGRCSGSPWSAAMPRPSARRWKRWPTTSRPISGSAWTPSPSTESRPPSCGSPADPTPRSSRRGPSCLRQDPHALDLFNDIHYRRSRNTIAKEWYAYALSLFGRATDIHDLIELLEEAIASEHYRPDRGWTARWNLACALRRLPSRAAEALDVLLPALEHDAHTAEVFECCLLWALEQNRQDVLGGLFLRARYHEAHLLAALQDVEARQDGATRGGAGVFRDHFRRINRILRDPDRVFPDPKERLTFDELDQLTRDFIESSLVAAGIEWFRQRVAYGTEGRVFKNWECAAVLNEGAGDLPAGWRCRQQSWRATQHKKNVDPRKKTQVLRSLLGWALRYGFQEDAIRVLKQTWRDTGMSEADARMWEERLGPVVGARDPADVEPGPRGMDDADERPAPAAATPPPGGSSGGPTLRTPRSGSAARSRSCSTGRTSS